MKNLIESTISKIKKEHIQPEPKWKFLLKKYGTWLLVTVVIFFGAISIATSATILSELDWDLYRFLHQSMFIFTLSSLPYFWLILLGIFFVVAYFEIRKTENGYKFSLGKILAIIFFGIIVVGAIFSFGGWGRNFNRMMKGMPMYNQSIMDKENQWMRPDQGLLTGTISSSSAESIKLTDLRNNNWEIEIGKQTFISPRANIIVGEKIKIIGKKQSQNSFIANEIRPWIGAMEMGGGGCMRNSRTAQGGCRSMMNGN
jgi:hypothetical protein